MTVEGLPSLHDGDAPPVPADPAVGITGKRTCAAAFPWGRDGRNRNSTSCGGGAGLEEGGGKGGEDALRKRAARPPLAAGGVGEVVASEEFAQAVMDVSMVDVNANVGDSSPAVASAEFRPGADGTTACGIYAAAAAALDAAAVDPVFSTTVVDNSSSASPATTPTSMVMTTATAPLGVETPQFRHGITTGPPNTAPIPQLSITRAVGSAHPPSLFSGSGDYHPPSSQHFAVRTPQLVVGAENGAYGCDAPPSTMICSPPPPPPQPPPPLPPPGPPLQPLQPVLELTTEPPRVTLEGGVTGGLPCGVVNEFLLQIPSLAHQMHAVSPPPPVAAAFGSAAAGIEEGLISVAAAAAAAAAAAGIPSVAALLQLQHYQRHQRHQQQQQHPPPLLPLRPAEPTEIDVGAETSVTSIQPMPPELLPGAGGTNSRTPPAVPDQGAGMNYDGRAQLLQNRQEKGPATSSSSASSSGGGSGGGGGGDGSGGNNPSKRRRARRPCGTEGCKRRPIFGAEGTRRAQFCSAHKLAGFVNVLCKQCDAEGCKHQPSFGVPGGKPVRCATHRSEGMVNLSAPKCVAPSCRVVPSFAKKGAKRASACAAHRRDGDVDVVSRRCHHEGCVHRPVFGYLLEGGKAASEKKAHYCSAHKIDGKKICVFYVYICNVNTSCTIYYMIRSFNECGLFSCFI